MKLLKDLYRISSPSKKENLMQDFIVEKCDELGVLIEEDELGNLYITKGEAESYPCIVAHMDEVCPDRTDGYRIIEQEGVLMGFDIKSKSFSGIGGDDKNGIWVALKCLEKYDVLKCAFFVGEEIGCYGSSSADIGFFKDCRFVLQCDRRGAHDLITEVCLTDLCSEEFLKATNHEAFGYKTTSGMLTDVYTLKGNGLAVSCCNISCGYYNPHSEEEYTIFSDLQNCLSFVQNIIENCTEVYPHTAETTSCYKRYSFNDYDNYDYNYNYGYSYSGDSKTQNWDEIEEEYWDEYSEIEEQISYMDQEELKHNMDGIAMMLYNQYQPKHVEYDEVYNLVEWYAKG